MFENYILKRKCLRSNYRVVAEIKNNGDAEYLVEFKKPFITFDLSYPTFHFIGRWGICYEWISSHRKELEGLKNVGWCQSRHNTKEGAYKAMEQELQRCNIQYGSQINKREVV